MSLERWIKEGYFDPPEEIDLDLSDEEIQKVKNGEVVVVQKDAIRYAIYLKKYADRDNLKESDLIIRELG